MTRSAGEERGARVAALRVSQRYEGERTARRPHLIGRVVDREYAVVFEHTRALREGAFRIEERERRIGAQNAVEGAIRERSAAHRQGRLRESASARLRDGVAVDVDADGARRSESLGEATVAASDVEDAAAAAEPIEHHLFHHAEALAGHAVFEPWARVHGVVELFRTSHPATDCISRARRRFARIRGSADGAVFAVLPACYDLPDDPGACQGGSSAGRGVGVGAGAPVAPLRFGLLCARCGAVAGERGGAFPVSGVRAAAAGLGVCADRGAGRGAAAAVVGFVGGGAGAGAAAGGEGGGAFGSGAARGAGVRAAVAGADGGAARDDAAAGAGDRVQAGVLEGGAARAADAAELDLGVQRGAAVRIWRGR